MSALESACGHAPALKNSSGHARQAGVSLIELMVGMVIGLLVTVAAMGSLMYTRTASHLVGDSTRLQQEAATAMRVIGGVARQAGARRLEQSVPGGPVVFNPAYAGHGVHPITRHPYSIKGTDGTSSKPDTLEIRRDRGLSDEESTDCLGEITKAVKETTRVELNDNKEQEVNSLFKVVANRLHCDGSGETTGAHALVSGVEDFQVWYGLREGHTLRYTTANTINSTTPQPWDQVETLRVCLRLVGGLDNLPSADATGCQGETIANDGRLRRVFFRVFHLRNAGP